MELNKVYCIDNLELLKQINDESVDLIYSDILYATGRDFKDYKDIYYTKDSVFNFYDERIFEMHRALSETGTLALQMDYRISHWIRNICDKYFGYKNCVNVVQWSYSSGGSSKRKLSQKNDEIIIYAKNRNKQKFKYHQEISYNRGFKPYRFKGVEEYQDDNGHWYTLVGMRCIWNDIHMVGRTSSERNGYATQKPLKLMNRIRDLYTNENDLILDVFMGSGAMIESAKLGNRNYIGCDINPKAVEITNKRLEDIR